MSGFGWESSGGGGGSLPSGFLQVAGGVPLDTTLRTITDGLGNASPLQLSTTAAQISGNLTVTGTSTLSAINAYIGNPKIRFSRLFLTTTNVDNLSETEINTVSRTWSDRVDWSKVFLGTFTLSGVAAGTPTNAARLHVRGDGTNPIARFENSAGTIGFRITNDGIGLIPISAGGQEYITAGYDGGFRLDGSVMGLARNNYDGQSNVRVSLSSSYGGGFEIFPNIQTQTSGNIKILHSRGSFGAGAGSANYRPVQVEYTLNNSGAQTGTATGIFLNATETALNGMTHNLMDLQVGGSSRFRVDNNGSAHIPGGSFYNFSGRSKIRSISDGNILLTNAIENNFNLLQFAGFSNLFPALKRNGAALEVRLADDSGFADLSAKILNLSSTAFIGGNSNVSGASGAIAGLIAGAGFSSRNASAILQADSTTMGFLPPRMTTTQVNAIATPAEGLVVYNTTISHLCVYQAGAWVKLSHSPM